jgi:hypothetical protein
MNYRGSPGLTWFSGFLNMFAKVLAKSCAAGFDGVKEFSTELEAEMNDGDPKFLSRWLTLVEDVVENSPASTVNPKTAFLHCRHALK